MSIARTATVRAAIDRGPRLRADFLYAPWPKMELGKYKFQIISRRLVTSGQIEHRATLRLSDPLSSAEFSEMVDFVIKRVAEVISETLTSTEEATISVSGDHSRDPREILLSILVELIPKTTVPSP